MPQVASLKVQPRERAGKGAARADLVLGIVYGGNTEPTLISTQISLIPMVLAGAKLAKRRI